MKKEERTKLGLALALVIFMLLLIPSVNALTTCVNCSDCNTKIQSASYGDEVMLTADIIGHDGTCIEFNGKDGITFNGGGHIISGDGDFSGFGIYLSSDSDDNTLKNCEITGFRYGIKLFEASNNTIQNITAYSNRDGGITIFYSTANTIRDCILQENAHYDFHFRPNSLTECNNRLINVTGSGGRPIAFYNQSVNLHDQVFSALYLCNADNSVLNNITIQGSDSLKNNGLRLFYTDNTNLTDIVSSNNFCGVLLDNADTNKLQNIKCNNNHHQGIHVCYCSFNTLESTETNSNSQCGIYLFHSPSNKLTHIASGTNSFAGVYVDSSSSTIINNSYIRNNVDGGINIKAGANLIHNNYFCNAKNINFAGTTVYANDWNIPKTLETNIVGGSYLGGNYWATPSGTGFSEMCTDTDGDGICDDPYILATNNIDHLPLTKPEVPPRTIYVNEIGWWIEPDPVNPSATPIQSAVSNANAGDTIIVHDGTYTENVDVLEQLTIRSANGSANCIVSAADIDDHVFDIYKGHVNISGFTIRGGATEGKAGIYLNKGVSHCRISNNNCTQNHRGISLYFADSNTIIDNTADSNCWYGIYLFKSDNNHVINNSARFNEIYMGICITYSDYNYLVGNTANHNGWEGIRLYHSDNSVVSGNNVNYNNLTDVGTGLLSWASNNAIMTDNIARQNAYGIYLYSASSNNTVINNIASECEAHGILVYQSSNATICDNDANNNGYHGIFVYDSPTSNITIYNNTASNNFYHGIFAAYGPSNLKIMGNTMINNGVSDNLGYGIYMGAGSGAIISDNYIAENTASNQAHGIKVFSFTNVAIHGNTIVNNCDYGIMLDSVSGSGTMAGLASGIAADDDDMPAIENEGVAAAQPTALALLDGDYSSAMLPPRSRQVGAGFPTGVNVSENMITDNADGIWLNVSDNVMIAGNIVTNNGIGVNLTSSDDNIIYNNYFDNTNNAYDDGTNEWNTTSTSGENIIGGSWLGGNYWGDYIGVDNNEDGLGDTMRPYNSSGNIKQGGDWHPLVEVATSLPDLKITDIWVCWPENCTICYNVTNVGTGTAQAGHITSLLVDGTDVAYDCVTEALSNNESYIGCFDYIWVYTPLEDNITVCADYNNTVSECNESNNFRTKKWICGDPNEDGSVDTTDVIAVWDCYTAGISLKNKWATDTALDNGVIDTNDVIAIWNNYVSGSVLNCSCSG